MLTNNQNQSPKETKTCQQCILDENTDGVHIEANGACNLCNRHKPFIPYGENLLLKELDKAKSKGRIYDALVPLSGGKDSTYVLYLAVVKYKLKVLTYTFDNGFMSDLAKQNIESAIKKCHVDHIWVRHDLDMIKELYRTTLMESGEICGICGVGIERSMLKISESWRIPIILLGHAPTEANSFTAENIYDHVRLKAILALNPNIKNDTLKRFFIYPHLNYFNTFLYTKTGRFGKKVNILYYLDILPDKEIGRIIKQEMDWREPDGSEYTRHFDCLAEPLTNYVREKRLGSARRLPQLSNMIRNKEISKETALKIAAEDKKETQPANMDMVMSQLNLTDKDIAAIVKIPINIFGDKISKANKFFATVRNLAGKNS